MLAASAPPGCEVAVFDVKAAHRRVPISPAQQPFCVILWNGLVALNHCCQFGAASSSGLWGRIADAFRCIFAARFPRSDSLNWADDFIFWRYILDTGGFDLHESDIESLAADLGWPWSAKKTKPFASKFIYLGFVWDLVGKWVSITDAKRQKYLSVLRSWRVGLGVSRTDVAKLLGKLVHCTLVIRDGRSRLPALSRFSAAFANKSHWVRFKVTQKIMDDVLWWISALSDLSLGLQIRPVPEPRNTNVFVDASSSWGIGVVIDSLWAGWRLAADWKTDGRDIGWAEMVAIEIGLLCLVELGFSSSHIVLRSDNRGVVGAFDAGRSRNTQVNRVLQRIVTCMLTHDIWVSCVWVPTAENIADPASRGLIPANCVEHHFTFSIPFALRGFVEPHPVLV